MLFSKCHHRLVGRTGVRSASYGINSVSQVEANCSLLHKVYDLSEDVSGYITAKLSLLPSAGFLEFPHDIATLSVVVLIIEVYFRTNMI